MSTHRRNHATPRLARRLAPKLIAGVLAALRRSPGDPLRLIAEIKLRSPSAGDLSRALAPADRALALEAGFAAHLAKPVQPELLLATLVAVCGKLRSGADR